MKYYLTILMLLGTVYSKAQLATTVQWNLNKCIDYALANNIQVKKAVLDNQSSEINYTQQKFNRLPSVSASGSLSFSNGNSIDPITSNFINQSIVSNSYGITGQMPIYQGNMINLQIDQNKLMLEQSKLYQQQAENNIVLDVIQNYLQALYYAEGITIAQNSLTTAGEEVQQAQIKYDNGAIAELELSDLQTQYASAQYSVVAAQNQFQLQVLQLKQILELDPGVDFQIEPLALVDIQDIIPDKQAVFAAAAVSLPDLKIYDTQAEILDNALAITKSGYKPTLSLSAGVNTGYTNSMVYAYGTQLDNNLSPQAGLMLSIPIFSKNQTKTNGKLARINIAQNDLDKISARKTLYSNIENTWQNAVSNQAQQQSAKAARDNAALSYELARKKYEFGGLTSTELSVNRNNYLNAEQTLLQTRYLTSLYTALLNFYQGKPYF